MPRPRTVCKKVWVPHEECRTVSECKMVCKPVCTTVQVPVCRKVLPARRCGPAPATVCRMVPEQCVRYETRTRCYQVPEEKVCQIPYTTCRMVPRAARPLRDATPLLLGARARTSATHLHHLPDGPGAARPDGHAAHAATACPK